MTWRRPLVPARVLAGVPATTVAAAGYGDGQSPVEASDATAAGTDRVSASVRWNQRAVALVVARPPAANAHAAVSRTLTYLSLVRYCAVVAARHHAHVEAAGGGRGRGRRVGRGPHRALPARRGRH